MTDYDTYGTSTHTASELVHLVTGRLELVFTEHESYYRGIYHLAYARRRSRSSRTPFPATTAKTTSTPRNTRRFRCCCSQQPQPPTLPCELSWTPSKGLFT